MQFLESLLDEMDSRSASAGAKPPEPPLYLPIDSFDLPGLDHPGSAVKDLSQLGLPPLPSHRCGPSATAPPGTTSLGNPGTHLPQIGTFMPVAPTAGSAAPSPVRGVNPNARPYGQHAALARRAFSALEEKELYEFDEAEISMQTSKSGRVRKVTNFTGGKRKASDMVTYGSAPAALAGGCTMSPGTRMLSDSGIMSAEDDDDEVEKMKCNAPKSEFV